MKSLSLLVIAITAITSYGCQDKSAEKNSLEKAPQDAVAVKISTEEISKTSAEVNKRFDEMFNEIIALSPETQSYLGIKDNSNLWDDISETGIDKQIALKQSLLTELNAIDAANLDTDTNLSLRLFKRRLNTDIQHDRWRHHYYPVNQMFGIHSSIPSLLINVHGIDNETDANNYIARLNGVSGLLDQTISNLNISAEKGIVAPAFVFNYVINDSKNLIQGAPFTEGEDSTLLADFKRKVTELDNAETLTQQAEKALLQSVKPGYENLINWLTQAAEKYTDVNGVWALPDGEAYYNDALAKTTTTALSADEIHNIGLQEVDAIHTQMKAIMAKVGFEGSLAEFFVFMREDPQFYLANTAEGKAQYLESTNELISTMKSRLDELFITKPKADLIVKAVEPYREKSAGKAFYYMPAPDGSRPGTYYVNLYQMDEMPIYQMEALAYHEALPGHHMQIAISQEMSTLPKFRRFDGYTAYTEGWGLYSEQIPKDMGLYSDPYSDFGRLAMALWRAARLVVDTGLHAKKWTKQQAIDYLVDNTPNAKRDCKRAIERYLVMPSQATAYYIGMLKIQSLKAQAQELLGDDFDIREYHDVVLENGAVPLDVLEEQVLAWVASKNQ